LRELIVTGCPPVMAEVKTLNALLPPWDDIFLAPEARVVPKPLRMIIAPTHKAPSHDNTQLEPSDNGRADEGVRKAEGTWVTKFITKSINKKLGCRDWGKLDANGSRRTFFVTIESFAVVEKLPQIADAIREAIAKLRYEYVGSIMIALTSPVPEPTPAQVELEKKFQAEQEEAEFQQLEKERQELLERQHRYDLKKQLGEEIKPEDFAAPPAAPLPPPPWERDEEEEDEDSGDSAGNIRVKEKVEPPPDPWDNEHPLADKYRLIAHLTLSDIWFHPHNRDLAAYLMGRQPDEEIPDDAPKA